MATRYQGRPEAVRALDAYIRLMRGANSVLSRLVRRLLALGLTENQFGVLEILLHLGSLSPGELKTKLLTTGGNITMILDNLEKRGLVHRERHRDDKRRLTVRLTAEGRRRIERIFPGHVEAIVAEMSILTAAEQETLGRLCRRLGLRK
jgi:MarR family transcriptional regulator, 2-MHQ and catechol-resistance regulon repressor